MPVIVRFFLMLMLPLAVTATCTRLSFSDQSFVIIALEDPLSVDDQACWYGKGWRERGTGQGCSWTYSRLRFTRRFSARFVRPCSLRISHWKISPPRVRQLYHHHFRHDDLQHHHHPSASLSSCCSCCWYDFYHDDVGIPVFGSLTHQNPALELPVSLAAERWCACTLP